MANQRVTFRRGPKSTIPNTKVPGTLLIATDTGEVFLDDTEEIRIQLQDSTKLSLTGGTVTGDINMSGNKITNIGTPSNSGDIVNKSYVDTQITNISNSINNYLPLSGGTMSGNINLGNHSIINVANPINASDVANKSYIDNTIESLSNELQDIYLPLTGGMLSGILNLNNNRITGVGTPTSNSDAANKNYVDTYISGAGSTIVKNNLTESRTLISDTSGKVSVSTITSAELGYLDGVTSNIQTQLNEKANSNHTHSYLPLSGGTMTGSINLGTNRIINLATPTSSSDAVNKSYVDTQLNSKQNIITGAASTVTTNGLTGNRVVVSTTEGKIGISSVTSTELGYLNGVTSSIQTQLNNKLSLSGGTLTGDINLGTHKITNLGTPTSNNDAATKSYVDTAVANVSGGVSGAYLPLTGGTMSGEISMGNNKITNISTPTQNTDAVNKQYVDTQITSARPNITGAASTIITSNLTASRAVISDSNGKIAVSDVTSTELGYLDGVTSAIQTQLNSKASTSHAHSQYLPLSGGTMTGNITLQSGVNIQIAVPGTNRIGDASNPLYLGCFHNLITNDISTTSGTISNNPEFDIDIANKKYVDDQIATITGGVTGQFLPISGGTMVGNIDMGNHSITNFIIDDGELD